MKADARNNRKNHRASRDYARLALSGGILLLAIALGIGALSFPVRLRIFPLFSLIVVSLLAVIDLGRLLRSSAIDYHPQEVATHSDPSGQTSRRDEVTQDPREDYSATSSIVAISWFLGFMILTFIGGFLLAIPIYIVAFMRLQGRLSWKVTLITLGITWAIVYGGFVVFLDQRVYGGILFG